MYKANEYESVMEMIDKISAEPIDDTPYNIVANPKPVVESVVDFNGIKVDTGSWTEGDGVDSTKEKVGKAKTTKTTKVEPVVKQVVAADKKSDGQVVKMDARPDVKVTDAPKAASGSSFDASAKTAKNAQTSKADSNKKFMSGMTEQKKAGLFRTYIKSLGVDEQSKKDAEAILAKFDEITKFAKKSK